MKRDIVVIGASAGGVQALQKLIAGLPEDLAASVFIALHSHPRSPGMMADILNRAGDIKVSYPENGDKIERGRVYLARPDYHLLLERGTMRVVRGPKENGHRPAIDPLFRSAAVNYGPRVVGVILTGYLNDGTSGLIAIKECGGLAVVHDPEDAQVPDMPRSALRHVQADHCVSLSEIAPLLDRIANTTVQTDGQNMAALESIETESRIPGMECQDPSVVDKLGRRSTLTCPECMGTLWEINDENLLRYRCHVGHALTGEHLAVDQITAVEKALWLALKTLEESATLARRLAARQTQDDGEFSRTLLEDRGREAEIHAATLRQILMKYAA
jgi:two-component system chemotaxis response regulator CheB